MRHFDIRPTIHPVIIAFMCLCGIFQSVHTVTKNRKKIHLFVPAFSLFFLLFIESNTKKYQIRFRIHHQLNTTRRECSKEKKIENEKKKKTENITHAYTVLYIINGKTYKFLFSLHAKNEFFCCLFIAFNYIRSILFCYKINCTICG